jgi:hypothetical protein
MIDRTTSEPLTESAGEQQFCEEVFPAEIAEIRRRRENAGDDRPLPEPTPELRPSTEHGLVGLAFSGGGIRSAAFSLGVAQALIRNDLFKHVDYLSTVSGGGYTGSCLNTLMSTGPDGERRLVDREGGDQPSALEHVRNYSNYLLGRGVLAGFRMPALFIAGALHTLLLMVPLIVLLVFFTELFFELSARALPGVRDWLPILGFVPLGLAILLRPVRAGLGTWAERDARFRRLGSYFLLAVCSLLAVPVVSWLGNLVDHDADWLFAQIDTFIERHRELRLRSWLLWVSTVTAALLCLGFYKLRERMLLIVVGALGPLVIVSLYVLACVYAVNTSVSVDDKGLGQAVALLPVTSSPQRTECGHVPATSQEAVVQDLVAQLLETKSRRPSAFQIQWQRGDASDPLVLVRCDHPVPRWRRALTTSGNPRLHVRFTTALWSDVSDFEEESRIIVIPELSLIRGHAEWWLYLSGLVLWLYNHLFVTVNRISMHPFYRDRLSRTFLIRPDGHQVSAADDVKLSELCGVDSRAPYHLVNTALNLQGSDDPKLRERGTVPMVLASRYSGSDYTGYCPTTDIEARDPQFNLGSAMAISAAAAAPNMGALRTGALTFVMALLNIRLNYWLPNPAGTKRRPWYFLNLPGRVGLGYLLAEALGRADTRSEFVNCSDGGHIENLGVYELLKRRCRTIVCVDGAADPRFEFESLVTLQRYAEIDLGARFDLDLSAIRPPEKGPSKAHHATGRIVYPNGEESVLVYLKLAYTGDEPEYLRYYRRRARSFPHESTGNQFFGETKFEAYRALGTHTANGALEDLATHVAEGRGVPETA